MASTGSCLASIALSGHSWRPPSNILREQGAKVVTTHNQRCTYGKSDGLTPDTTTTGAKLLDSDSGAVGLRLEAVVQETAPGSRRGRGDRCGLAPGAHIEPGKTAIARNS